VGQDPITMAVLVKLIKELNDALGITSVIVTHDVKEVLSIADYAYIIANRKVVAHGTPEQLREEHNPEVEQFLKGLPDGPVPFHFPAGDLLQDL
jgi:phospholipid/cholesterol/gamma-HCH transport system ATP-binding protein